MNEESEFSQEECASENVAGESFTERKKRAAVADSSQYLSGLTGKGDADNSPSKFLGYVRPEQTESSSSDSDPDSDFNEYVNDVKENRDVYWD
jgi:hypothetical protein